MKLENWGDLFKYNKELLDDDYNHGQSLVLKTKSKGQDGITELSSTYKQGAPNDAGDSKVGFEAKFKTTTGETSHEAVAKQDGSASYELKTSLEKFSNVKDLNLVINASASTVTAENNWKVGLDFGSEKAKAKLLLNLKSLLGDVTLSYLAKSNVLLGANLLVDTKKQNLEKYDWGVNWSPAAGAVIGLKHESLNKNALELGRFFLFVNHAATASQVVGTEFALNWQTKALEARLGLSHKYNEETSGKFKVNQNGWVDAVLKHKINNNVTASFATGFGLKSIIADQKAKVLPVGLQLDIKL